MYADQTDMHLMDQEDYSQYSLPLEDIEEERKYITEDLEGMLALIYNDECVGIQIPQTVELLVTQCDPGFVLFVAESPLTPGSHCVTSNSTV